MKIQNLRIEAVPIQISEVSSTEGWYWNHKRKKVGNKWIKEIHANCEGVFERNWLDNKSTREGEEKVAFELIIVHKDITATNSFTSYKKFVPP
jgi:hypothetical protein